MDKHVFNFRRARNAIAAIFEIAMRLLFLYITAPSAVPLRSV